jgi:anti-anti-sigma regulatory factor
MATRHHAVVSDPAELGAHDHIHWQFDGLDDFNRVAVAFFEEGRRRNERLMYVTDDPGLQALAGLEDVQGLVDRGALQLASVAEVYGADLDFDPGNQLEVFAEALRSALTEGYRGLRVAADNTAFVRGARSVLHRWMQWEYRADRFIAENAVTGLCGFNGREVADADLDELATLHPVISSGHALPGFRLFHDGGAIRVIGSLDGLTAGQLRRVLQQAPPDQDLVLDLSATEFFNHSALIVLGDLAVAGRRIELTEASPAIIKLADLLGPQTTNLRIVAR